MLTAQDLMTLDSIRLHFATQGKTYWAGVVQRAIEALSPPPVRMPSDPGGAYIGVTRGRTPANEAARAESGPAAGEIPGRSSAPIPTPAAPRFSIDDDRAPGKLAAEAKAKGLG